MEETKIVPVGKADSEDILLQYIIVNIGNEQYGIHIGYVDNIVRMEKITRVPKSQDYFVGVINLRGDVIPVISVRTRLKLDKDVYTDKSRIIIIKVENALVGLIVDQVKEVVTFTEDNIENVSYTLGNIHSNYVSKVGKNNGELISLIDIIALLNENE